MCKSSSLISSITLTFFLQVQIASALALPTGTPEQKTASTLLYLGDDPYTQALLRLEYDGENNSLEWQLLNNGLVLSSQFHAMPEMTESVDSAVIYGGDQIIVAGRTINQNWFLRALNSQGEFEWQRSGEGRIYDLAFSDNGKTVYAVGRSENAPLFTVVDAASGTVQFHADDAHGDKDLIYKQLVIIDEEVVVAEHNSKGDLKLSKWKPVSHTAQEFVRVRDFCKSCIRAGIESVAMEKGYLPETVFNMVLYDNKLEVTLIDSTTGKDIKNQMADINESVYWNKVLRINGANLSSGFLSEKWLNRYLIKDNRVKLYVSGCKLVLATGGLPTSRRFDFCDGYLSRGHKRKLLQVNASGESDGNQDEISYPEQRAFMILEWVLGGVGLIETTLLAAGIIGIVTGSIKYFQDKKEEKDERIARSKEKELLRRNNEGQLLSKFRRYDPLTDLFSSRLKMLPGAFGASSFGFEGVILPDKESGGSCVHLHHMERSECDWSDLESKNNIMKRYFVKLGIIKKLFENASNGNTEEVRDTITDLPEYINHPDDNGNTVLHFAVATRSPIDSSGKQTLEHIKFLILHGADVEATNNYGLSPTMMAVQLGNITAFKELIRAPNISVESRSLLVHMVVRAETSNSTPYFEAILERNLHSGINFHQVCRRSDWLSCDRASSVSSGGLTILHEAAITGNYEIMELIIKHDLVEVNETDDVGNTALHYAVLHDHDAEYKAIKLLIRRKADSLVTNDAGVTPLRNAEYRKINEIEELLKSTEADAHQRGNSFELR